MNHQIRFYCMCLLLFLTGFSQKPEEYQEGLILPGAEIEKLAGGFLFTEGPSADKDGNVYFTDQPNDRIMIWTTDGVLKTFMQPCGRSNGLCLDKDDNLWACADEKNELWKIGKDKSVAVVLNNFGGNLLNGPNDLWITKKGDVYFTDPFYKRSWWQHTEMKQDKQCVYLLKLDKNTLLRVEETLVRPNGIAGSPDGNTLYVSDIGSDKTWSYSIAGDGTLTNKVLFCDLGSDGMTIDEKGNLYLTGKGVTVFDRSGKMLFNIPVPEKWTANVCFGDKDRKSLFITSTTGLYRLRMRVRGAE